MCHSHWLLKPGLAVVILRPTRCSLSAVVDVLEPDGVLRTLHGNGRTMVQDLASVATPTYHPYRENRLTGWRSLPSLRPIPDGQEWKLGDWQPVAGQHQWLGANELKAGWTVGYHRTLDDRAGSPSRPTIAGNMPPKEQQSCRFFEFPIAGVDDILCRALGAAEGRVHKECVAPVFCGRRGQCYKLES